MVKLAAKLSAEIAARAGLSDWEGYLPGENSEAIRSRRYRFN